MPIKILPDTELLNHLFSYDPETGHLTWKNPTNRSIKVGDRAGCLKSDGYIYVGVVGKGYKAHRLIYKMQHGVEPGDQLDHINRVRTDNRISNLREATPAEQQRNQPKYKNNTSGTTGIRRRKEGWPKPWEARIYNDDGKRISKYFKTEIEAIAHRRDWMKEFNYVGE